MSGLNIYIVEDEPLIVITIETALRKNGYNVIGDSDNVEDAISEIPLLKPDLVLLDIQLEGSKEGTELAKELDGLEVPYLFLTSQTDPDTIIEVKKTNPIGYVVKPFTESSLHSNISIAWHNFISSKGEDDTLSFKSNNQYYKIKQSEILYLQAFDNYCYIKTNTNKYIVSKTLKFFSEKLNESFIKSHRSYIVNIEKATSLKVSSIVYNQEEIPISKAHKSSVKQRFISIH